MGTSTANNVVWLTEEVSQHAVQGNDVIALQRGANLLGVVIARHAHLIDDGHDPVVKACRVVSPVVAVKGALPAFAALEAMFVACVLNRVAWGGVRGRGGCTKWKRRYLVTYSIKNCWREVGPHFHRRFGLWACIYTTFPGRIRSVKNASDLVLTKYGKMGTHIGFVLTSMLGLFGLPPEVELSKTLYMKRS